MQRSCNLFSIKVRDIVREREKETRIITKFAVYEELDSPVFCLVCVFDAIVARKTSFRHQSLFGLKGVITYTVHVQIFILLSSCLYDNEN